MTRMQHNPAIAQVARSNSFGRAIPAVTNGRAGLRPAAALRTCALPRGMSVSPTIHGQDARATVTRPAALSRLDDDAWGRTVTKRRVSGAATHRTPTTDGCRFRRRWPRHVSASGERPPRHDDESDGHPCKTPS
jgi:hypothetical protein